MCIATTSAVVWFFLRWQGKRAHIPRGEALATASHQIEAPQFEPAGSRQQDANQLGITRKPQELGSWTEDGGDYYGQPVSFGAQRGPLVELG